MRNSTIRYVMALAAFSIVGIIVTQVYWVRRAFDIEEQQFNQSLHVALKSVAERIALLNQSQINPHPIEQLTSNYYVVNVNDVVDAGILEVFLEEEFSKINLNIDYEYGIYDCSSNEMVYGNYISHNKNDEAVDYDVQLLKYDEFIYYFGIRFPTKATYLASQMDIWVFSSFLLLIVIIFFAYTLFVIFKQKRLSEVQRDFINNMTHEFKTPISTIAVSSDLITNPKILDKPESLLKYANIIKSQNNRLKNQIEKVLQMAIMDQGKLKLNKENLDLHKLIREMVQNFNLKTHPDLTLNCHLDADSSVIRADKVHLTNIIYNLLDNAMKYVNGSPVIEIRTSRRKNHIVFSIKDNGIGISKEHQKKIFDKFFRVPTGNVHNVKGFGLGLNYVKLIIKVHKWVIRLESEPKKGSTFYIQIPLILKETQKKAEQEVTSSATITAGIKEQVNS